MKKKEKAVYQFRSFAQRDILHISRVRPLVTVLLLLIGSKRLHTRLVAINLFFEEND